MSLLLRRCLLLFGFISLTISAFAQRITGLVSQPDGKPAEFATITLHKTTDSTLVKGALSGDDGTFEIRGVDAGRYFLQANLIGFATTASTAFDYPGGTFEAPAVKLTENPTELQQVTVTARRPTVEVKADKTVLNVEGTVNSTGLSALELLRKAPGVTVDNNENVSVKGKNSVKVMIDGRDVPLDGANLAALLKGTQAADIANIEIISNPSAKYDAAGNAGIINIRLKKNKAFGTNGNIGAEGIYGQTAKGGLNLSLNNRSKGVNTFGSYNNFYGTWHNTNDFFREQSGLYFDQKAEQENRNKWNSARVGTDVTLNSKNTVGVLLNGYFDDGDWASTSVARIGTLDNRERVDSLLVASNEALARNYNFNANVNYRYTNDSTGRSFNVDIDRGLFRLRSQSFQPNFYRTSNNEELLNQRIYRNSTPTNIDITTAKADYEQRLWKGTLGLGVKVADVKTDNTFDFFNEINGVSTIDTAVSNQFVYKERTSAAYVNYNRMFGKKLNVQAGLRLENTDYMGDLISYNDQNGEVVENNYTKLFPSAAVTYSFNQKMGLNATYSRRIDRPSYQDLNPFENKLDELTFSRGNPRLRPQFTNAFEIAPTYNGYPVISLGYSHTKDVFTQVLATDVRNPRATFMTQENIADQQNYTATLNIPTPFAKWYEGFISITGMHSRFKADFDNLGFSISEVKFSSANLYAEQTVKLPHGWSVQLSGWYSTPSYWGTLRSGHQGVMDFGVQKKLFDGKGQVRVRFGDLLNTAGWTGENVFTPGLLMTAAGTWEARTVTVNFSYRFGSNEVKAARQRKTGLEDEKNRVKAGRG